MATSDLLDSLRDLDLPPAPSAQTSALLIVATAFCAASLIALIVVLHRRRYRWISEAATLIKTARQREPSEHLLEMSAALRRIALLRKADPHTSGEGWLRWLDSELATQYFTAGDGRIFGHDLYQQGAADGAPLSQINDELMRLLRRRRLRLW